MATLLPLRSFLRNSRCIRSDSRTLLTPPCRANTSRTQLLVHGRRLPQIHAQQSMRCDLPRVHGLRTFSTSTFTTLPPTTLVDPTRPSLFYHLLTAPNPLSSQIPAYAVSFLDHPSKDPHGPAVLGWLPAAASSSEAEEAGLGDFKENGECYLAATQDTAKRFFGTVNFINLMHDVIRKAIEEGTDERLNAEALQRNEGWMHINGNLLLCLTCPHL